MGRTLWSSIGFRFNYHQRNIDPNKLLFRDQIETDGGLGFIYRTGEDAFVTRLNGTDLGAGLLVYRPGLWSAGFSGDHLANRCAKTDPSPQPVEITARCSLLPADPLGRRAAGRGEMLTTEYGVWAYVVLGAIVFAETGLVVTPFLPGDSLLFACGAISVRPGSGLNPIILGTVLIACAIAGDTVNYHVGKAIGHAVRAVQLNDAAAAEVHRRLLGRLRQCAWLREFLHRHRAAGRAGAGAGVVGLARGCSPENRVKTRLFQH